jgi:hypothetical protein
MNNAATTRDSLSEAINLISGTTVSGVFYTLVVVLFCLSARLSYSQLWNPEGKIKRQTVLTLTLACLMIICATMDVTLSNIQRQITFVDYGTLSGGPLGLPASLHATTVTGVRLFVRLIEKFLISGVLVSLICISCHVHSLISLGMACFSSLGWDPLSQARHSVPLGSQRW